MSDESPPARPKLEPLPRSAALVGLLMFGAAFLPLVGDATFFDFAKAALARDVFAGLMAALGFGSPFLFGLAVAVSALLLHPVVGVRMVRFPIALMHSQLLLVAWAMYTSPPERGVVAALPLLLFSVVSGLGYAFVSASAKASSRGITLGFTVRWGAMLAVTAAAWMRLQSLGDTGFGFAVDTVWVAGILLVLLTRRTP